MLSWDDFNTDEQADAAVVNNTINSVSNFYASTQGIPLGENTITMQIVRVGSTIVLLRQHPGGQWIVERYFKAEKTALVDGWFPTGDIATIDAHGTMQIRDRTKDVIKTGGEWISSIDLENAAVGHPAVAMAAVIGVKHPKWDERPLLFIVRKPGQAVEKQEILDFLATKVAKWWVPDDVVFLESLPVGGTGKVQKNDLRKEYGGVFS
jgi:fatty-acyl-CoA synthase